MEVGSRSKYKIAASIGDIQSFIIANNPFVRARIWRFGREVVKVMCDMPGSTGVSIPKRAEGRCPWGKICDSHGKKL